MILFVSDRDWANMSYILQKSLEKAGVEARAITLNHHAFDYPEQAELIRDTPTFFKAVSDASCIVWMHSQPVDIPCGYISTQNKKRKAVFHGGSAYRNNPAEMDEIFSFTDVVLYQNYDLQRLSKKVGIHEMIMPAVDTDLIKPAFSQHKKRVVAHFPRGVQKGTQDINEIMAEFQGVFDYRHISGRIPVSWSDNMKRLSECDIYIASLPFDGCTGLGLTLFEAAALGKIVINPFEYVEQYQNDFGEYPLPIANDKGELRDRLNELSVMSDEELQELQGKIRAWVESQHSYQAVGDRLARVMS